MSATIGFLLAILGRFIYDWIKNINPIKLNFEARHILPFGNNAAQFIKYKIKRKKNVLKNNKELGLPAITLTVLNRKLDVLVIKNVELKFAGKLTSKGIDSEGKFDFDGVSGISMKVGLNHMEISKNDFLKKREDKSYTVQFKDIIKCILKRGIKSIVVEDNEGKKLYASKSQIRKAVKYLKYFNSYENISDLYKHYPELSVKPVLH